MTGGDVCESKDSVCGKCSKSKIPRLSPSATPNVKSTYCPSNFQIVKLLHHDNHSKSIFLHIKLKDSMDKDGILILQKTPFPVTLESLRDAQLGRIYGQEDSGLQFCQWEAEQITNNDIYHRFAVTNGLPKLSSMQMTVIHPAEAQHFAKYSASKKHIVLETPEMFKDIIVPFLVTSPKDLAWVDNILNGTAETERVLFFDLDENVGFTVVLDYRWDGRQLNELHCLCIARSQKLSCLRDLTASHIPMLKKMLFECRKALISKYNVNDDSSLKEDQIMAYFHYPPTFYRLHMHFKHVDGSIDGGNQAGKAHIVEDVIANLEMKSDYYATRTINIYLHENHSFFKAFNASVLNKN